jgi:cytochrome oxidase assembly protein ShyY1
VLVVTGIACLLFLATWAALRPWWEKALVNETERR